MSQFQSTERKQIRSIVADYIADNPSGASPADSVTTETTAGQSSSAGAATTYSRGDHTHGTPALGSHTHPESDVVGLVSDLASKAATSHAHAESDITGLAADFQAFHVRQFVLMGA